MARAEQSVHIATGPGRLVGQRVVSPARVYNHVLGGRDNFQIDRDAAEKIVGLVPDVRALAVANYRWAARVARLCVRAGIVQVVDIGMGIPVSLPSSPSVYEAVREENFEARVVGVDFDPVVLMHGQVLRGFDERVRIIDGDVREPQKLLADVSREVDFDRPVLLLLAAVLHFVTDEQDPGGIVCTLTERLVPGSRVAISHATSTGVPAEVIAGLEEIYKDASSPGVARTEQEIEALFTGAGLVLDDPGPAPARDPAMAAAPAMAADRRRLVDVQRWRPEERLEPRTSLRMVCGVGRVPGPSPVPEALAYPARLRAADLDQVTGLCCVADGGSSPPPAEQQQLEGVSVPGRAYAAVDGRDFERACGLPAASRVARGRGVSWVYAGLTYAQAAALADRLEERAELYTGAGSHPDDRVAGRSCRDTAVKIRAVLAEHGGTT